MVADEVQNVLRRELAQWWVEAVTGLSTRQASRSFNGGQGGGATGSGSSGASPGIQGIPPVESPGGGSRGRSEYLYRAAHTLAQAQFDLSQTLESHLKELRDLTGRLEDLADQIEGILADTESGSRDGSPDRTSSDGSRSADRRGAAVRRPTVRRTRS